jgi:hypothetical protein
MAPIVSTPGTTPPQNLDASNEAEIPTENPSENDVICLLGIGGEGAQSAATLSGRVGMLENREAITMIAQCARHPETCALCLLLTILETRGISEMCVTRILAVHFLDPLMRVAGCILMPWRLLKTPDRIGGITLTHHNEVAIVVLPALLVQGLTGLPVVPQPR